MSHRILALSLEDPSRSWSHLSVFAQRHIAVPHASSVLVAVNWHMESKARDCKFRALCLDKARNSRSELVRRHSAGYCSTKDAAEIEVAKAEACVEGVYNHRRKPHMGPFKCGSDDSRTN